MKKRTLLAIGAITVLLLTGCQSSSSNAETEALKEQVAQLEQQIADLQTALTTPRRQTIQQRRTPRRQILPRTPALTRRQIPELRIPQRQTPAAPLPPIP